MLDLFSSTGKYTIFIPRGLHQRTIYLGIRVIKNLYHLGQNSYPPLQTSGRYSHVTAQRQLCDIFFYLCVNCAKR